MRSWRVLACAVLVTACASNPSQEPTPSGTGGSILGPPAGFGDTTAAGPSGGAAGAGSDTAAGSSPQAGGSSTGGVTGTSGAGAAGTAGVGQVGGGAVGGGAAGGAGATNGSSSTAGGVGGAGATNATGTTAVPGAAAGATAGSGGTAAGGGSATAGDTAGATDPGDTAGSVAAGDGESGGSTADGGGSPATNGGPAAGADPTAASLTTAGPYKVESYSTGFEIGPDFPGGTIWYPSDSTPPYVGIAIVPGFVSPRVLIEGWGPFLASHGIVTFTIDTNSVTDQPDQRSRALVNALQSLAKENSRADSPLNGKLDNDRQAVGGWSMGGGGTLITVNAHPELKAGMAMCAWQPGGRFSTTKVPTLMFASSGDPLAGGQSQGFYSSIPDSTPKILFEWGAGDHFMANDPTGANNQVGALGLSWLKVFLEGDERYRPFITVACDGCTDYKANVK